MAGPMGFFTDYVNYRAARKDQIRSYLYSMAANTPSQIAAQWRLLQAEQEAMAAMDKSIEALRQRVQQGLDTRLEAAIRAEGTQRTAKINAEGSIASAQIGAQAQVQSAMIRAKADTIPAQLDARERAATAGSGSRAEQAFKVIGTNAGTTPKELKAVAENVWDQQYASQYGQVQGDPLQRVTYLQDAHQALTQALSQRMDVANAAALADAVIMAKSGRADFTSQAKLAVRQAEQARIEAGLGGATIGGARTTTAPQAQTETGTSLSRADLANTDAEGLSQLAIRATLGKLSTTAEGRAYLAGKDLQTLMADPSFVGEVKHMRDSAPMVELLTYGDERALSLMQQRQQQAQSVDTMRRELLDRQNNMPSPQQIEDQATLAFVDLLGSDKAKKAVADIQRSASALQYVPQDQWQNLAPIPTVTSQELRQLPRSDAQQIQTERQQMEDAQRQTVIDALFKRNESPLTTREVSPDTADAIANPNIGTGRRLLQEQQGAVNEQAVSPTGQMQPTPELEAQKARSEKALQDSPENLKMQTKPDDIQVEPDTIEFQTKPEDIEVAPIDYRSLGGSWTPDKDPLIVLPTLLADRQEAGGWESLSDIDRQRGDAALQRLAESYRQGEAALKAAPQGSEEKADAAQWLLDIQKVAVMVEKAQRPAANPQAVEAQRAKAATQQGQAAAKSVALSEVKNPSEWLKRSFGRNALKHHEAKLVQELAKSKVSPAVGSKELPQQLQRIAGARWVDPDVREQMRALYAATNSLFQATGV